jgi:hypothetical protein
MNMPAKIQSATVLHEVRDRERLGAGLDEQRDEGDEHERRAEHRVEEELQRGVLAVLATPDADHEVHREQDDFEEDEEQDEVLGDEGAGHARLEHEHQHVERLRVARGGHVVPGVDHHEHGDDHRVEVQREADPVEADRVRRLDRVDPVVRREELERLGAAVVELREGVHAHGEGGDGREQRHSLRGALVILGDEQHHQHARQRQEGAEAEQPLLVLEYVVHGSL